MKAVVDTNVVACLLLGTTAFVDESRQCFEQVVTPLAPAHWEAELANVVWMAVKAGVDMLLVCHETERRGRVHEALRKMMLEDAITPENVSARVGRIFAAKNKIRT